MDKRQQYIWLSQAISYEKQYDILCRFDNDINQVWEADEAAYIERCIDANTRRGLCNKDIYAVREIQEKAGKADIGIVTIEDDEYPRLLREIPDAPILLYVKGKIPDMVGHLPLAMIGTRAPSVYAAKMAQRFSYDLARAGVVIVSGLARGIDTICHRGALTAERPTVAVLGCGVDQVYPPENAEVQRIISETGAVISEYPPGVMPLAHHFPQRNRIISGMARGVFVLEGTMKSGTMITTRFALDTGRSVLTIPTNLDNVRGDGNIALIQQGAKVVTRIADVFEEFAINYSEIVDNKRSKSLNLTEEQRAIYELLEASVPVHIDEICRKAGLNAAEANSNLTLMEISGYVQRLPRKQYILNN